VRLLVETDLPVKVIVDRAGFGSHEHLRRLFRKFGGMTPDAYRRQHAKAGERAIE
jgi:AraC-like DNA-binding protein